MKLKDRVAIVTGAVRGLGRAFCVALAKEGAKIMAVDIADVSDTMKEIESLGGKAKGLKVDVSSEKDTLKMAEETVGAFGKIDILVNNAAIIYHLVRKPFYEIDPDLWDKVMAVNVKGPWLCTKAVFPHMKAQKKGKIINFASETFFTGSHGFVHYVASKGGVVGLTRSLAVELGPHNITINPIAPGFTDSERQDEGAVVAALLGSKDQTCIHHHALTPLAQALRHPHGLGNHAKARNHHHDSPGLHWVRRQRTSPVSQQWDGRTRLWAHSDRG